MTYQTKILSGSDDDIKIAAKALKDDEVVAIPTETVYGLAANAFSKKAVEKIFIAKGRPLDNPLIVHISDINWLDDLIAYKKEKIADILIDAFWPGPLTLIFKKSKLIQNIVSANLDTVAIRFPSHIICQKIITACNFPLVAPSANISGIPSATSAIHVFNDLNGKIPYIVDGNDSEIGIESTVVSLVDEVPKILRLGKITIEDLKTVVGEIDVDENIMKKIGQNEIVSSPGMKHKHYSPPNTDVKVFCGNEIEYADYVNTLGDDVIAMCFDEDIKHLKIKYIRYGKKDDFDTQSKNLFNILRKVDETSFKTVVVHSPKKEGLGLSIYNRLIKSADYEVINCEQN